MERETGLEPATPSLEGWCSTTELFPLGFLFAGRGDRIRTYDPMVPNHVRYQTAPRPVLAYYIIAYLPSFVKINLSLTQPRENWNETGARSLCSDKIASWYQRRCLLDS
jgi:hypothetical protein